MHHRIHSWQWICIYIYGQQLVYGSSLIFKISLVVFSLSDTVQHSLRMVVLFILCNFILCLEPSIKDSEVQLLKRSLLQSVRLAQQPTAHSVCLLLATILHLSTASIMVLLHRLFEKYLGH